VAEIAQFKSVMKQGGARSNQFRCYINFPAVAGNLSHTQAVSFLAHGASLPSADVADIETWFRGRAVHFAGERTFQPWGISIYNDNDFTVRNAFEKWVEEISHGKDTNGLMVPLTYQTELVVQQLDRSDQVIKSYRFVDAYPTNVGAIQLSWDANNQIQSYDVNFVYNYWQQE
jgi:hypothetical protein